MASPLSVCFLQACSIQLSTIGDTALQTLAAILMYTDQFSQVLILS